MPAFGPDPVPSPEDGSAYVTVNIPEGSGLAWKAGDIITVETASGTDKKDKEADDRVKRALDRDFGAPAPEKQAPAAQPPKEKEETPAVIDFSDDFK